MPDDGGRGFLPNPSRLLFLQGPPGRLWGELGEACRQAGFEVFKIHQCLPEELGWPGRGTRFRGQGAAWPEWLADYCRSNAITDILYYADRLPDHVEAAQVADRLGIRAWVIENGYLRPDWLTFEPFGMSAFSRLPLEAERIQSLADDLPEPDLSPRYGHGFRQEGSAEVLYGLLQSFGKARYPEYRADRYYAPLQDYVSWALRTAQWIRGAATRTRLLQKLLQGDIRFTLLAMQLQSDYQIRSSSPYDVLSDMLAEVIASFAVSAPSDRHLLVKGHPLDNGWENWPRHLRRISRDHGVSERVHWLDGGPLPLLIDQAESLITVNSTVGLKGILQNCPVLALGSAVYNRPGLTHQGEINRFWTDPEKIDSSFQAQFLRALIAWGQVRGSFYDPRGRTNAVKEIVNRLKMVQICGE
ncbi:MAG: capsular biosynthesis protein [Pseudomonadota bacterium]